MNPDEYQAISRMIANDIDIDLFDDTTYQPHRLMYFPSTSQDGEFIFKYNDGVWVDADEYLNRYDNWQDQSFWPVSSRVQVDIKRTVNKQEDPLSKKGIIGAFCRSYTIQEAIENIYLIYMYHVVLMIDIPMLREVHQLVLLFIIIVLSTVIIVPTRLVENY